MNNLRDEFARQQLINLYDDHPCNANNILVRLERAGRSHKRLTEIDFAQDNQWQITDQNHVGGISFVKNLASAAELGSSDRVLDLGCGLGGSDRLLAHLYQCHVDGFDISPKRIAEGNELSHLVGLNHMVTLECADFRNHPVPEEKYDCLWGQGAWVHVKNKRVHLGRWLAALSGNGRVAMEDSYLRTSNIQGHLQSKLQRLSEIWKADIPLASEWINVFSPNTKLQFQEDLTEEFITYFRALLATCNPATEDLGEALEQEGWTLAISLAEAGVIGYTRIILKKTI